MLRKSKRTALPLLFTFLALWAGCGGADSKIKPSDVSSSSANEKLRNFYLQDSIGFTQEVKAIKDSATNCYNSYLYKNAIEFYTKELPYRIASENKAANAICLCNIGICYLKLKDYDIALQYLQKSYSLDTSDYFTMNELAKAHLKLGDYDKSLNILKAVLPKATQDYEIEMDAVISLSNIYYIKNNDSLSLYYAKIGFEKSIEIKDKLKNQLNISNVLLRLKKYTEARLSYLKILEFAGSDSINIARAYTNSGIAYKHEKNYPKALEYTYKGLAYKKDGVDVAASFNNLADIFLLQNKLDSAFHYYQKAITTILPDFKNKDWKENPDTALFKKALSQPDLMGYLRDKADALKKLPQYGNLAIETYKLADYACDVIRKNSEVHESKLFWREKAYPLYREAIKLCYRMGKKEEAYRFFEKSRAILLLDKLNENVSKTELNTATSAVEILPQDLLQQQLDEDELFIEYFTPDDEENKDSVFVFTVSKQSSDFKKLYFPKDSIFQYQKYISLNPQKRLLTDRTSIAHLELYLFETLLKPLGIKENTHKLIISADGILQSLPFETLKSNSGKYLIYDYAVQYAYSVSTLYLKRPREQKPLKNLLCIAPIEFGNHKDITLPTLTETKEQSDFFNQNGNVVLTEKEAVKQSFIQTAQEVQVIQLLTHASASGAEPCIYFYDSLMTLNELYKQHFPAALAVLTACETAIGTDAKGEGVLSLAHGFAYSGVPATVATLWKVSEEHTISINQSFYENLKNGMSKSEALRKAKCDFISSNPALSNPYYWAAPILYGDDAPIVLKDGFSWWWLVACIGIMGFIVFLGYLKVHQLKKH